MRFGVLASFSLVLPFLLPAAASAAARGTTGDYFAMHVTDCRLEACQSSAVFLLPDGRQQYADPTRTGLTPSVGETAWQNRRPNVFTDVAALAAEIARLAPADRSCNAAGARYLASGTLRIEGRTVAFRYDAACTDAATRQSLERLIGDVREKLDLGLQPLISG